MDSRQSILRNLRMIGDGAADSAGMHETARRGAGLLPLPGSYLMSEVSSISEHAD